MNNNIREVIRSLQLNLCTYTDDNTDTTKMENEFLIIETFDKKSGFKEQEFMTIFCGELQTTNPLYISTETGTVHLSVSAEGPTLFNEEVKDLRQGKKVKIDKKWSSSMTIVTPLKKDKFKEFIKTL